MRLKKLITRLTPRKINAFTALVIMLLMIPMNFFIAILNLDIIDLYEYLNMCIGRNLIKRSYANCLHCIELAISHSVCTGTVVLQCMCKYHSLP